MIQVLSGRRRHFPNAIQFPNYVCNSIGGVASTSVFDFLTTNLPKVTENRFDPGVSQWKHTLYPPICPSIRKGIFLFGDPRNAMTSIFRRNLCKVHLSNKGLPAFPLSLEEYLDQSRDVFRTFEHIRNWTTGGTQYPVLCVKSEVVFECADEICEYFEIAHKRDGFPTRRANSTSRSLAEILGEKKLQRLEEVLIDAINLYNDTPNIFVLNPRDDEQIRE